MNNKNPNKPSERKFAYYLSGNRQIPLKTWGVRQKRDRDDD